MTNPIISVIIPVYNVEKYLRQCLDSVINQTCENIQIVCVNDASTDNSLTILNEYAQKYARIIVIDKKVNEGAEQARKTAFEHSNGEYVIMIDSDDWLELNMLEKMYERHCAQDCDMVICGYFEENDSKTIPVKAPSFPQNKTERIRLICFGGKGGKESQPPYIAVWNKLIKREIYEKVIFLNYNFAGDHFITCQTSYYCEKICSISDDLYHYRIRDNSLTTSLGRGFEKDMQIYREIKNNYAHIISFCREKLGEDFRVLENSFKRKIIEIEMMNPNKSVAVREFEILLGFVRESPERAIKEAADYIAERVKLNLERIQNTQEEYLALGLKDILSYVQKTVNAEYMK